VFPSLVLREKKETRIRPPSERGLWVYTSRENASRSGRVLKVQRETMGRLAWDAVGSGGRRGSEFKGRGGLKELCEDAAGAAFSKSCKYLGGPEERLQKQWGGLPSPEGRYAKW